MVNKTELQNQFITHLPNIKISMWEPMAKHTSFKIGGPAEIMVFPQSPAELAEVLKVSALLDSKITILGAGTNILAPDTGIPGLVICLKDCFK